MGAAEAIARYLDQIGARRIALVSPYPASLVEAAERYWRSRGIEVAVINRIDIGSTDTRKIYELSSSDAMGALETTSLEGADAVVLSGTGLPTLGALRRAREVTGLPVVSSNYCLAWELLKPYGLEPSLGG